jgi:plastocyanin
MGSHLLGGEPERTVRTTGIGGEHPQRRVIAGKRSMRPRSGLVVILLATWGSACGGDDSPTDPDDGSDGDGTPAATTSVSVNDDFFDPQDIAVASGATVTWTWVGGNPHNVTWVSASLANSATQSAGSHSVTMPSAAGQRDYYCTIHGTPTSGMRGSVLVQ